MARFRPSVDPASPGIQRQAKRYGRHLRTALQLAARRDSRRDPDLAKIYASATVADVDTILRTKTSTISFQGKPLRGSFHLMYEWRSLLWFTPRQLADGISLSVRDTLNATRKRQRRKQ
jgi:hypothetical protein